MTWVTHYLVWVVRKGGAELPMSVHELEQLWSARMSRTVRVTKPYKLSGLRM